MDVGHDECANGLGVELEAGGVALELPVVVVGVEDVVSEEVVEDGGDSVAIHVRFLQSSYPSKGHGSHEFSQSSQNQVRADVSNLKGGYRPEVADPVTC